MSSTSARVATPRAPGIRQQKITAALEADGHVEVSKLAAELDVTEETIRRDLRVLEQHGLLRRTHGGAIQVSALDDDLNSLLEMNVPQLPIACEALAFLPDVGSVYLDVGRLTESVASMLGERTRLQVVTSSIPAALAASRNSALDVYNLGGRVSASDGAESGQWAREELARVRVDVAFLSADGMSSDAYLTAANPKLASIKNAVIDAAEFVVLLADEGGLETGGLVKYAPLSAVDVVIVGAGTSDALVAFVKDQGPEVRIAPVEEGTQSERHSDRDSSSSC
jgi:DeoR family transcriptional regulator, fructose operon transcriptional repressor